MGAQGDFECRRLRKVLQRSHHRPVRGGDLERQAVSGVIEGICAHDHFTPGGQAGAQGKSDGSPPPPVTSRAILVYNRARAEHLADGIVITPSHNPPEDGGFKYNPPNGGPADTEVTQWVENRANEFLRKGNTGVKRVGFTTA